MNTVLALIIMMHNNTIKSDIPASFSRYLIANLHRIEKLTMRDISNESYISTSSIINYCKALGFNSYSEFKHQLFDNIKIRKMQINFRYGKLNEAKLLEDIAHFGGGDFDPEELDQAINQVVDLIWANSSLSIIGALFPVALSYSFQEDLVIMGKPVYIKQLDHGEINHEFTRDSLILLITITGRFIQISSKFYHQIIEQPNDLAVVSQDRLTGKPGQVSVALPSIGDSEYNDVILLLIFDLIKIKYYKRYFK